MKKYLLFLFLGMGSALAQQTVSVNPTTHVITQPSGSPSFASANNLATTTGSNTFTNTSLTGTTAITGSLTFNGNALNSAGGLMTPAYFNTTFTIPGTALFTNPLFLNSTSGLVFGNSNTSSIYEIAPGSLGIGTTGTNTTSGTLTLARVNVGSKLNLTGTASLTVSGTATFNGNVSGTGINKQLGIVALDSNSRLPLSVPSFPQYQVANITCAGDSRTIGVNASNDNHAYPGFLATLPVFARGFVFSVAQGGTIVSNGVSNYSNSGITTTGSTTSGSTNVTITGSTSGISSGMAVGSSKFATNLTATISGTAVTLSSPATATGSTALSFAIGVTGIPVPTFGMTTWPGSTSFTYTGTPHLLSKAVTGVPSVYCNFYGYNDVANSISPTTTQAAYASLVSLALADNSTVVVMTIPWSFPSGSPASFNPQITALNTWIKTTYANTPNVIIDDVAALPEFQSYSPLYYTPSEGVHFTDLGYSIIAQSVASAITLNAVTANFIGANFPFQREGFPDNWINGNLVGFNTIYPKLSTNILTIGVQPLAGTTTPTKTCYDGSFGTSAVGDPSNLKEQFIYANDYGIGVTSSGMEIHSGQDLYVTRLGTLIFEVDRSGNSTVIGNQIVNGNQSIGTLSLSGTTNPTATTMDGSFGSNAIGNSANMKLVLIKTQDYGVGVTAGGTEIHTGSSFYVTRLGSILLTVDNSGNVTAPGSVVVGTTVRLHGYTVSTLPSATIGDTAYVTDALTPSFGTILVGGGAIVTKAFYNGTNWVAE